MESPTMRFTISALALVVLAGPAAAQHHDHGNAMHAFSSDAREAFTATPAFGPDGALWVARGTADRVVVAKSTDLGKTFTDPVSVTAGPLNMDWGPDSRPQLVVDKTGAIVVTYAIFQDKRFNGRIYATRSTDGGTTFATPIPITSDSTSQRFQTVGLDSAGQDDISTIALRQPLALVLGAEGKGLRQLTRETCSVVARLDMPGEIKSLNVSNAAVLALYIGASRLGLMT